MIELLLFGLSGLLAGLIHALSGPDHLAAVAPLALSQQEKRWWTGLWWGIGHSLGVWMVGALALLLREAFPLERLSSWSERLVGAVLIAVGLWGLRRAFRARLPRPGEEPAGHRHPRATGRAALSIGTLHGLAGSSHLLGLFPALALPTVAASASYVGGFGLGTVAAMVGVSSALGLLAGCLEGRERAYRTLLATTSAAAIAVGGFWLAG